MVARIDRILHDKKALLLSLDEGLREGPGAFTLNTIDPAYVFQIALEGHYTGIAVNPGIAEKYLTSEFREVPVIINLNAQGNHHGFELGGSLFCTVERAIKLGAQAVGFTLQDTKSNPSVYEQFAVVVEQAHDYGIPVIAWMHHHHSTERDAYAARLALELGADAVSLSSSGDQKAFEWIVRCAGRTAVFLVDDRHVTPHELLGHLQHAVHAGATGAVYGRMMWQHPKPFSLTRAIQSVLFRDRPLDEAMKYLS